MGEITQGGAAYHTLFCSQVRQVVADGLVKQVIEFTLAC
jgi:hypothetical protein